MGVGRIGGTFRLMATNGSLESPPVEALDLHEGISLLEAASSVGSVTKPDGTTIELGFDGEGNPRPGGVFDADGRVPLHVIRPGIGRGRGRHLYEASMLQEAAPTFTGWKMFVNHLSPEAKKAAGGLPRDVRDLGGRVQESWWDGSVPANSDTGHGDGAVVGMVRPVKAIRSLIDDDPQLVEASISASATNVRPVHRDGERVWLVEGINPRGSVDWVTEAGAGGRIAPILQEAYADEEDVQMALLESMSDDELRRLLQESRPTLLQEAGGKKKMADGDGDESDPADKAEDAADGGADEDLEAKVEDMKKKGMPEKVARNAAKKALSESRDGDPEGGDVPEITPEAISEALTASPDLLVKALQESGETQVFLASLVEAKLEEERSTFRAEARADVDRAFQLAKLERQAHQQIAESRLPDSWKTDLKSQFSLSESNEPSEALDVTDEVGEDGKVKTPAADRLREAVSEAIQKETERLREASTTRVRHSTGAKLEEAKADDEPKSGEKKETTQSGPRSYWAETLAEAGVSDPEKAYALEG